MYGYFVLDLVMFKYIAVRFLFAKSEDVAKDGNNLLYILAM